MISTDSEKKKRRIGLNMSNALAEVLLRKQYSRRVAYEEISERHSVGAESLRQVWSLWNRGEIEVPPDSSAGPDSERGRKCRKELQAVERYLSMLIENVEAEQRAEEKAAREGKPLDVGKSRLSKLMRELERFDRFREDLRKQLEEARNAAAQPIQTPTVSSAPTTGKASDYSRFGGGAVAAAIMADAGDEEEQDLATSGEHSGGSAPAAASQPKPAQTATAATPQATAAPVLTRPAMDPARQIIVRQVAQFGRLDWVVQEGERSTNFYSDRARAITHGEMIARRSGLELVVMDERGEVERRDASGVKTC